MNLKCPGCKKDIDMAITGLDEAPRPQIKKDVAYYKSKKPRIGHDYQIDLQNNNAILGRKIASAKISRINEYDKKAPHYNCGNVTINYYYNNHIDKARQNNIVCDQMIEQFNGGIYYKLFVGHTNKIITVTMIHNGIILAQYEKPYTKNIWFFDDKFIETYDEIMEKCKLAESLL